MILPNLGGSLRLASEYDLYRHAGLPTIWGPHLYPGCGQHGVDEHLPIAIVCEGLAIMAGILWDLGHC